MNRIPKHVQLKVIQYSKTNSMYGIEISSLLTIAYKLQLCFLS
jgi:hypothetical protein